MFEVSVTIAGSLRRRTRHRRPEHDKDASDTQLVLEPLPNLLELPQEVSEPSPQVLETSCQCAARVPSAQRPRTPITRVERDIYTHVDLATERRQVVAAFGDELRRFLVDQILKIVTLVFLDYAFVVILCVLEWR
jgi:hypothetical protein